MSQNRSCLCHLSGTGNGRDVEIQNDGQNVVGTGAGGDIAGTSAGPMWPTSG